jgi:hypothetical protein
MAIDTTSDAESERDVAGARRQKREPAAPSLGGAAGTYARPRLARYIT